MIITPTTMQAESALNVSTRTPSGSSSRFEHRSHQQQGQVAVDDRGNPRQQLQGRLEHRPHRARGAYSLR